MLFLLIYGEIYQEGLIKMNAKEKSLTFLREQVVYSIPYFQRGYVWDEENWEGIWSELTADRKDCFLGSIILKAEEHSFAQNAMCKSIIDGQQRLTTLTILLRALMDYFKGLNADESIIKQFEDLLFYHSTEWLEAFKSKVIDICRISHSRLNREDYENVIEGLVDPANILPSDNNSSRILRCYKFFSDCISRASENDIRTVVTKLIVDSNKILVVIDLGKDENEQIIFDTINSTGVKLTAADIIKNALFQNVKDDTSKRDNVYNKYWYECFEKDEDTVNSWLQLRGLGQNQRSYIDLFFYCFAILKGFYNVQTDRISDLASKYKEYINKFSSEETITFIKEICEYAQLYKDTFIGFDSMTCYTFEDDKARLMQLLGEMNITAFDAFILYAVKNYDDKKRKVMFNNLERYVVRHYIIGNSSKMGSFTVDASDMISDTFDYEKKFADPDISDNQFKNALRSIRSGSNKKAKLLLFWVELHRHTEKESDLYSVPLNYSYELEHIMPQAWEENWGIDVLPVKDNAGNVLPKEEAIEKRNNAVYQIGNMTLLTSRLNKKIQNSSFDKKVNGVSNPNKPKSVVRGMKEFASLSITKEVISVNPLCWNEQSIENRTNKLISEIISIWPCEVEKSI